MSRIYKALFMLLILVSLSVFANAPQGAVVAVAESGAAGLTQTQLSMTEKECGKYRKADATLNRLYNQILNDPEYKRNTNFIQKFKASQRAWIAFRDAQLEAFYPDRDNPDVVHGSVFPMCYCIAQTDLTLDRTKMLRAWAKGQTEGDVCEDSIKINK